MIDRAYCRHMARYNTWQNNVLREVLKDMNEDALTADAGLPKGSVLASLNHLLWLDRMWLSRLHGVRAPKTPMKKSTRMTESSADWWAERFRTDGALRMWADTLATLDLTGDMAFYSISLNRDVIAPREICVMHLFNQQTDQRAAVRQYLAGQGREVESSNLFQMPTS